MREKNEESRKKIISVALQAFYKDGYKETNMRSIAKKSNMTVGNIYRYFSSKKELFETILNPVVEKINTIVNILPYSEHHDIVGPQVIQDRVYPALQICEKNAREIIILLSKSKGSFYEPVYDLTVTTIAASITKAYNVDLELGKIVGISIIHGLLEILKDHLDDPVAIERLFMSYVIFLFNGHLMTQEVKK
jgi:AcrR family transcriptional regulator